MFGDNGILDFVIVGGIAAAAAWFGKQEGKQEAYTQIQQKTQQDEINELKRMLAEMRREKKG